MAKINLGRIKPIDRGTWSATYNAGLGYSELDIVQLNGNTYQSRVNANTALVTDAISWTCLADVSAKANHGGSSKTLKQLEDEKANHGYSSSPKTLKEVENDLLLKDAEQSSKVKDIENILNTSNINQTATQTASGRKTISLPKTAGNGAMNVKLEGLTAENLVNNGDFRNGTTWWNKPANSDAFSVVNNEAIYVTNITDVSGSRIYSIFDKKIAEKYYISALIKRSAAGKSNKIFFGGVEKNQITISSEYERISGILTPINNTSLSIYFDNQTIGETCKVKDVIAVNLPAIFASGNEPDVATCDKMFSSYFEGRKNFTPTGRVRSVGKNLFKNKWKSIQGSGVEIIDTGILIHLNGVEHTLTSESMVVIPNQQYTIRMITTPKSVVGFVHFEAKIYQSDDNKTFTLLSSTYNLRDASNIPFLFTPTKKYIQYYQQGAASHGGTQTNMQIYKTQVDSTYAPYKESKLYITAPELRSNGLIKDEIRKGTNGYELVKRVGVGSIGTNGITGGDFEGGLIGTKIDENGTISTWALSTTSSISGTRDGRLQVTTVGTSALRPLILLSISRVSGQLRKLSFYYKVNSGTCILRAISDGASSFVVNRTLVGSGVCDIYYKCYGTANNGLYFNGTNLFDLQIDNIKDELINVPDGIALDSLVTQYGNDINYSLATPIITPINSDGILNSSENGTIYHEPIVADAGIYSTKMDILLTDYRISSMEEIIKHKDGIDTYLDVAAAVIASGGLSFTHPSLQSGDLVLFTYAFNKENVNGLITATFYDSRYVIADTTNGKFYKWGVKSTNGVPTINLTEV